MAHDQPGQTLDGRYELIEELGRGGMAVVWRALTRGANGFQRPVAIKRIEGHFRRHPDAIALFVEEARVGSRLRHPNIVQVHDFRVDAEGDHYLVTELVEGPNLGQWVLGFQNARERTPWPVVTAIGVEVLRALDAAHNHVDDTGRRMPILHRDVTPGNILLDVHGIVKLADFGLARAMDRRRITLPDVVKGKLSYLAPELLLGKPPSAQSDLFSLGVVLWEALTCKRLFDAQTDVQVLEIVKAARVPMLSMQRPDLPLGLTSAIHRSLARNPGARFASARDMLKALTEVLRIWPHSTDAASLAKSVGQRR